MIYALLLLGLLFFDCADGNSSEKNNTAGYVSVHLEGQLGNQLFQIATAYAYALDHNLTLTIPELIHKNEYNIPYNAEKLFLAKIDSYDLPHPPSLRWVEPSFNYTKIPRSNAVDLRGFFQSEKYFKHRKTELLSLFAPPPGLNELILAKYPFLSSDALTVGIQIRDYRPERPKGDYHPTLRRIYYKNAMAYFPENTIFLVSSNNPSYARECTEGLSSNIIYLSADYIEEFYTLVLCKSFIISNSSFGWWASWLSTVPNKTVIAPNFWFSPPFDNKQMIRDLYPEGCNVIESRREICAKEKILIISHHYAQPFFIDLQVKTFKKFLDDDYEFVVFNDAKTKPLENEIKHLCRKNNIRCIRINPEIHQRPYLFREPHEDYNHPCVRCANVVQYSLDVLGFDFPGLVVIIDSDMFPIQPISFSEVMRDYDLAGVSQSRDNDVLYMWNGLVMLNMLTLPDRRSMNFNCGKINNSPVDAGGYTHYYISKYIDQIRMKWMSCEYFANTIKDYQNGRLSEKKKHLISLIDLDPPENMETLLDGRMLHYRGGGLWDPKPQEYYTKKNDCLRRYIEQIVNE